MSLERVGRGAVLLAAGTALVGIFASTGLGSGWLSRSMVVAWILLALLALFTVRRNFIAGEVLIALLAIRSGYALLLQAVGISAASLLDAAQVVLMAAAFVLFALDRHTARGEAGTEAAA